MSLNVLITEWVSRNEETAWRLRLIYLSVEYEENGKSSIPVSALAAENPKRGGDTRSLGCKHVCFKEDKATQRVFL
jgi:hypothetical protein